MKLKARLAPVLFLTACGNSQAVGPDTAPLSGSAPTASVRTGAEPTSAVASVVAPPNAGRPNDLGMIGLLSSTPSASATAPEGGNFWNDPSIKRHATNVSGRLPPEHILRVVGQQAKLRRCYDLGLARNPGLAGEVTLTFVIGVAGDVINADSRGSKLGDSAVLDCMVNELKKLHFAEPEGGVVTVTLPFSLSVPKAP